MLERSQCSPDLMKAMVTGQGGSDVGERVGFIYK